MVLEAPPSTESEMLPLGTNVVAERAATVMVMVSVAPVAGVLVAAVTVTLEASKELPVELGQALRRLKKSMDPRPEASS